MNAYHLHDGGAGKTRGASILAVDKVLTISVVIWGAEENSEMNLSLFL